LFNDVSERERIKYNMAYADEDLYDPTISEGAWKDIISQVKFKRALDVGCGPGKGIKTARDAGFEVYGIDISDELKGRWKTNGIAQWCDVAPASNIPAKDNMFDLTLCTEVMEHIPEELVDKSLQEIRRVSCGVVYFTIATRYIPKDRKWLADKFQPHLTVKPVRWWKDRLRASGFQVKEVRDMDIVSNLYICV
jgi:2-polyprenyl-3-methyl-5-hydroxy-6-metoxy-1,4-benzoquinol methylase